MDEEVLKRLILSAATYISFRTSRSASRAERAAQVEHAVSRRRRTTKTLHSLKLRKLYHYKGQPASCPDLEQHVLHTKVILYDGGGGRRDRGVPKERLCNKQISKWIKVHAFTRLGYANIVDHSV